MVSADDSKRDAELERLWAENEALLARVAALEDREEAEIRIRAALRHLGPRPLRVRDIMTPDPQVARLGDSLHVLLEQFRAGGFRRLPVLDQHDRLVGIVTDRDLRQACNSPVVMHERWQDEMLMQQVTVELVMSVDPLTVHPDAPVYEVARKLRENKIGGLPVLDEWGKLVGIISEIDLLLAFERALEASASQAE
jgi:CBS-domain-containing membrane protein